MCSKHEHCCSSRANIHRPADRCCSAPRVTEINVAGAENMDGCCNSDSSGSGGSCCSPGDSDEESDPVRLSTLETDNTQIWILEGMDCPSCARKIENAVNLVEGVEKAHIVFATEKLVVKFRHHPIPDAVEKAVLNAGFSFRSSVCDDKPSRACTRLISVEYGGLLLVGIGTAIAFLINITLPEIGKWMFTVICLLVLIPVGKQAYRLALVGSPFSIETLMAIAALGAIYLGETAEAAMVLFLFLAGEKLEAFASAKARSGVQSLMTLIPETTIKIINNQRVEVASSELEHGDLIEVSAGFRLPADGVLQAEASFDESALTGESLPVLREAGELVMAGSVVVDRTVQLIITSKQGENAIDRILHLIEDAESHKAPLERFLDKFSRWYTPLMMGLSLLVIIIPPLLFAQTWETWIYRGLALLLIACPCALIISTPAAITSGLAVAARHGILIKGGAALESVSRIDTIAFDKTGTLTTGKPQVTDLISLGELEPEHVLAFAASIEEGSSHPLAVSLVKKADEEGIRIPQAEQKTTLTGRGVSGVINGVTYALIAPVQLKVVLSDEVIRKAQTLETEGKTVAVFLGNDEPIGLIGWRDCLRNDAVEAVRQLGGMGIRTVMLTGDNPVSAATIGKLVGIDYEADLLPEDKVNSINLLTREAQVAMVGDGINDAPAMKAATVGIAMGNGTDIALETADAAITNDKLSGLVSMIVLSKATVRNIQQNVVLALSLKGIFLVTSLLGITGLWMAVLADSGATLLVTLNALRLLKK